MVSLDASEGISWKEEIVSEVASYDWEASRKISILKAASYLNDPICKVREYYYSLYILDETCKTTVEKVSRVVFLVLGMIGCALLVPFTVPLGIALRGILAAVQLQPFIFVDRGGEGKTLPKNRLITLVSHNECYVTGGYSITDGHVTPPSDMERMDANIRKIKELNPDIICLYEVADIYDALYLSSQFEEYPYLIPVSGFRAIGPSSMMYVASKYEIIEDSIEFYPFAKGTELTGRAQYSEKGYLSFDIKSQGEKEGFATIVSTHLQHSEVTADPEEREQISREAQMRRIAKQIEKKIGEGFSVVFTGDLNMSEKELKAFLSRHGIDWLRRDPAVEGKTTWGGNQWCAKLMGVTPSGPEVLDYTLVAGKTVAISTKIFGTGYSGLEFRRDATSDHDLLYSEITVGQ